MSETTILSKLANGGLVAATALTVATHTAIAEDSGREPFRPQFHYTPARNWMNDPNGLVFFEGEYHLFYQHNPQGNELGHVGWGHAVSRDLIHWEELPLALPERHGAMTFSGSAVVDWQNTSGFGQDGKPPLVAIYTADHAGKREDQCLASSNDRGRTWTFYEGNPVLDLGIKDFRDPKVFWHEPTARWIMAVSLANARKITYYASPDLKNWTHLDDFGPAGATSGVWECPDLFPLPIEGEPGKQKWVQVVNLNTGAVAGGSGCQYFVGGFDGKRFVPDAPAAAAAWADFGPDFYAAVTWSDIPAADGRRILLGWLSNWDYAKNVPTTPWRGAMSVPRALSLRRTPEGLRLIQQPVAELASLRQTPPRQFAGGTLAQVGQWLADQHDLPALLDVSMTLVNLSATDAFTVKVGTGNDEFTLITGDASAGTLILDRTHSGRTDFHGGFAAKYTAPLRVTNGRCTLRLLLDTSSLEVFAQGGETVLTCLIFPSGLTRRLSIGAANTGEVMVGEMTINDLSPAILPAPASPAH